MGEYCSGYCIRFNECERLGILDFMNVLPIHPSEANKNWCASFEENEQLDQDCTG